MNDLSAQLKSIVSEWKTSKRLYKGLRFVVGCSTSEVMGEKIGTTGSEEIAAIIFDQLKKFQEETGIILAFQCCEHLNRALVIERSEVDHYHQQVQVVPVRQAGGAMAAYAYGHLTDPVVIEHFQAEAGMDIGDTMIGMHMKHVAVPMRLANNQLGQARVHAAYSRPKLIGGNRAIYSS